MDSASGEQVVVCYIEHFPHQLPHRSDPAMRPCGHAACDPHTITYYGTGEEGDQREGDYCMVCYERTFPGMCPDKVLRAALQGQQA
jgi:hypothetical protein